MRIWIISCYALVLAAGCRSEPETELPAVTAANQKELRARAEADFAAERFETAAEIYRRLAAAEPADPALRVSLAGVLGAMGQMVEARTELEKVIGADPLNSAAYHNRAVLSEREGKQQDAIDDYRRAVRYGPQYEPSRRALVRLTGSPEANPPKNDAEKLAGALSERAAEDARAGNYDAALAKLVEAERIAPTLPLVHHYRSNVAYLKGDRAAAIAALDRALVLEPDNALFRHNRGRLENERAPVLPVKTPASP